jgi:hypothetical protein
MANPHRERESLSQKILLMGFVQPMRAKRTHLATDATHKCFFNKFGQLKAGREMIFGFKLKK